MSDLETPPSGEPAIRTIAMPADTNPSGDIFGGWLMSQMDLAGSSAAGRRAHGRTATVAVDSMSFLRPVKVGDEVSLYANVVSVGRTSLRVSVEAWRRPRLGEMSKVTQATFVFVAIGDDGRPRPLDPPA
jgi:acyl-CoA thioesterase YciA